jgi:hypothetical protein
MPALAHATGCRPQGARLKGGGDLFRAAGSLDNYHGNSTGLERLNGARADSTAQYGLTISQRSDKSGVTVLCGGAVVRSASVFMTACIHTGFDEFHESTLDFENEELAAAPKVGGNIDSIVRRYSDLHVQFSLLIRIR